MSCSPLLSEPAIDALPAALVIAAVRTGWFCRLLGPVSPSPVSLAVTPSPRRSIPSAPLEWMAFADTWLPVPAAPIHTPLDPLKAIVLPTMLVLAAEESMLTPWTPLAMPAVPAAFVPIRFPCMTVPVAEEEMVRPLPLLPEITFPAPAPPPMTVPEGLVKTAMP
jgi:hypothetical protein